MDMVVRGVLKGLYDSSCPQVNGAISEPDSLEE